MEWSFRETDFLLVGSAYAESPLWLKERREGVGKGSEGGAESVGRGGVKREGVLAAGGSSSVVGGAWCVEWDVGFLPLFRLPFLLSRLLELLLFLLLLLPVLLLELVLRLLSLLASLAELAKEGDKGEGGLGGRVEVVKKEEMEVWRGSGDWEEGLGAFCYLFVL
jgi:hypothetical protein